MIVDVDKLKGNFLNKMNDLYNRDVYFVESCYKFPNKYSLDDSILDDHLRIFFEENNKIVLEGKMVKYCDTDSKRKIKLINIQEEITPEVNIVNNYIVDDKWEKTEW